MTVKHLGFTDLRYVIAVAECGSFSRAAEACAITQPALSERIKRIENTLGVELFERNKRALRTTPIAENLIHKARELLDGAEALDEIVDSYSEPLTGTFRVGVIATLGPYLMPWVLPRIRSDYPELELILQEGLTADLLSALKAGSLDVVIAAAPLDTPGIKQLELFEEPFVLAIPVGHALAKRPLVYAADLHGEDMVLLKDGHCLSGHALDICPAKQRNNNNRLHAMSLETLRHMVACGSGYTLLPSLAVGENPPLSNLIRYESLSGEARYGRKIVMAWRYSFSRKADIECFASVIHDSLPELTA